MKRYQLKAKIRKDKVGDSLIPAVVYGAGMKNVVLAIDAKDFNKLYQEAGESSLIDLDINKKPVAVLIHEVQRDSVSDKIIHIDFLGVNMKKKIKTEIPIVFIGDAPAVSEHGGIFNKSLDSLEVESLPGDLPHEIEVDISSLKEIGNHIMVKDIKIDVDVLNDKEQIIASVVEQKIKAEEEKPKEDEETTSDVDSDESDSGDDSGEGGGESGGSGEEDSGVGN